MKWFKRKQSEPDDDWQRFFTAAVSAFGDSVLQLDYKDLDILETLFVQGADLNYPRHVLYYLYCPSKERAIAVADEASEKGFRAEIREPLANWLSNDENKAQADEIRRQLGGDGELDSEDLRQWSVVCETDAVLSPDIVRNNRAFFESLALRHSADYDGWEAAVEAAADG
jgi:hypothetical protein